MLFKKSWSPNGATKQEEHPAQTAVINKAQSSSAVNQEIKFIFWSLKIIWQVIINVCSNKNIFLLYYVRFLLK